MTYKPGRDWKCNFSTRNSSCSTVPVTAGFAYDVPVRFDIDHLAVNVSAFEAGEIPTIPLIEIRP